MCLGSFVDASLIVLLHEPVKYVTLVSLTRVITEIYQLPGNFANRMVYLLTTLPIKDRQFYRLALSKRPINHMEICPCQILRIFY